MSSSSQQLAPNTRWPDDWETFTSFTGSVYYVSDGGRLITTDDVHDPYTRGQVLEFYEEQREWFQDIDADDPEMEVFNVCDQGMIVLASWSLGETYEWSTGDLKPERRAKFWDYAWEFSAHRKYLPKHLEAEFVTALAFVSNDRLCDRKAKAFPFEDAQTRRIWQIYQDLKPFTLHNSDLVPALIYHVGRVMFSIASARDLDNYGTLVVDQTDGSGTAGAPAQWGVAAWNLCLAIILLGTHENYRLRLEAIVPKGKINLPKFRHLMRNLLSEWADSNLVATVIVSVNVGFLGVNGAGIQRSASLVSSICATISLITGVHHVWQHREKTDTEREDAKEYLYFFTLFTPRGAYKDPPTALDLAFTAALLAVPLALLVWAVLSFAVAIAAYAFERANHTLVLVVLGGLVALSGIMFAYFWGLNGWTSKMEREVERVGL